MATSPCAFRSDNLEPQGIRGRESVDIVAPAKGMIADGESGGEAYAECGRNAIAVEAGEAYPGVVLC